MDWRRDDIKRKMDACIPKCGAFDRCASYGHLYIGKPAFLSFNKLPVYLFYSLFYGMALSSAVSRVRSKDFTVEKFREWWALNFALLYIFDDRFALFIDGFGKALMIIPL